MVDRADLHLHTIYSNDAFIEPAKLLAAAADNGIGAIAITEHDNIDSWPVISALAADSPVEVIPGVEMYTRCDQMGSRDVLAYLFDTDDARLREIMAGEVACGWQQTIDGAAELRRLGYAVDLDQVEAYWHGRYPHRALGMKMMQLWMVEQGCFADLDAAIAYYREHVTPAVTVDHVNPHPRDVIEAIHSASGLAVLAHPGAMSEADIRTFVEWGIDGLEVHTRANEGHNDRLEALAVQHDLVVTGGSDWHGTIDDLAADWPMTAPLESYHNLLDRQRARFG